MKFIDPTGHDPGTTRTAFHKLEAELQLALEELEHAMAALGFIVVVKACAEGKLEIDVSIAN